MDESGFLASTEPREMLRQLLHMPSGALRTGEGVPTDRQLRLFVEAAGCAQCWEHVPHMSHAQAALFVADASCGTQAAKAALLRDIVGNPFRPVTLPPAVLTDATVRRLAAACDPTQPAHLAALGDALREAGLSETRREWVEPGANGEPKCPKCRNSLQNGVPADAPEKRRCATCKTVWTPERRTVPDEAAVALLRHLAVEAGAPWGYERCPACLGTASKWPSIQPDIAPCTYCRGGWVPRTLPHVPGCWAVDLLNGKE